MLLEYCDDVGLKRIQTVLSQFLDAYPAYETTQHIDRLRANEYGRLCERGHIYLDYTGGGP
jgi:hypothetical protein